MRRDAAAAAGGVRGSEAGNVARICGDGAGLGGRSVYLN